MSPNTPPPDPRWALFLDVDGTLVDFAAAPADVRLEPGLVARLGRLADALDGAVALVSGRPLAELDALFAPLVLPAAGLHGIERRDTAGRVERHGARVPSAVRERLAGLLDVHAGLLLEDKGATVALHYRHAPVLGPVVRDAAEAAAAGLGPEWHVQPGTFVYELKPAGVTKGTAVEAFVREPPFAGRRPVYVGDDLTDQHGIDAVERLGGEGIAVGPRVAARWRLPDPPAARAWLAEVLDRVAGERRGTRA
jgi:trehalose 6-phosphate phosphatase